MEYLNVALQFTDAELEAYLDESLDPKRAADIEQAVREDSQLLARLSLINSRRDAGIHTLGEIWRRNQIGVPSEETMQDFFAGKLTAEESDYIQFRLDHLKCPFTVALFNDFDARKNENSELSQTRREKFFEKSANLLNRPDED